MTTIHAAPRFRQLNGLVGRETEIQLLQDAYKRVQDSPSSCEAILLHGESGAGKTALVNETFLRQHEDGTVISGKFDIIHSARPYSAIVDALTQLCHAKTWSNISNEEEFLANLHKRLGPSDLKILFQLIPAMEHRFQELTIESDNEEESNNDTTCGNSASVDSTFAFARLAEVLRSFVYLIARYLPSPLVLFFDDVQAADQESLSIITSLTSLHSESQNLLLILAFRDEPESYHMARKSVVSHTSVFRVTDIEVCNLDVTGGSKLIGKLLGMDPEETLALSLLITQRTGGNVYFTMQFLEMLKDERLLDYCFVRCEWMWNLDKIRADSNVTENVALLLTMKIQQLPPDVQLALQLAACLGFYFDIEVLAKIAMQERADNVGASDLGIPGRSSLTHGDSVFQAKDGASNPFCCAIAKAVVEHLIDRVGGTKYKFTHDRVLQAVYEMIPDGKERDMLHWRIGEVLWSNLHQYKHNSEQSMLEASDDWLLFTAADQLNRGAGSWLLSADGVTSFDLAKLNLDAGNAAFKKSAFKHAADFFDKGVSLVKGKWHTEYSLCLELHTRSAEAEFAASNFDRCDKRINELLENGRCLEDTLPAYLTKIQSQGVRGRILEAIDESVAVLRRLGERIPRHPNRLQMLLELNKTKRMLKGRNVTDLASLPNMTSPHKKWAIKFMQKVVIFSWFAGQNGAILVASCHMMQSTVDYGISWQAPYVLTSYGVTLGFLGDLEAANELGKVALELTKRPHILPSSACTLATASVFLHHLKQPVTRCLDLLMDGYNIGIKGGDIEGAAMCLSPYASMGIFLGKKLDVVLSEIEGFRQAYRGEFDRNFAFNCVTPWHQFVLNLMGRSEDPLMLNGDIVREETFLAEVRRTGNLTAKATLSIARMVLLHIMGDVEAASKEVSKLDLQIARGGTYYAKPFLLMYAGLTMLGMVRKTRERKYWGRAHRFKAMMEKFVKAGNLNMPPMLQLMLAEQKSLQPRRFHPNEVKKAYESAVRVAAQSGFSVVEAIGYERAGEYMLSIGDDFWAKTYLSRALLLYDEWGAAAKTEQMVEKHAFLAEADRPSGQNISLTLRKRYKYQEANERRRMSVS